MAKRLHITKAEFMKLLKAELNRWNLNELQHRFLYKLLNGWFDIYKDRLRPCIYTGYRPQGDYPVFPWWGPAMTNEEMMKHFCTSIMEAHPEWGLRKKVRCGE